MRKTILNSVPNKRGTLPKTIDNGQLIIDKDIRCLHRVSQDCVPDSTLDNDKPPENNINKAIRE
jgi:hypothetical protein